MPDVIAHFSSYGVAFRLRADDAQQLEGISALLPHGTIRLEAPGGSSGEEFTLSSAAVDGQSPRDQLRTALMVHVANMAPEFVFLHAGVVSWRGQGLVLPGSSFAGKTTLVAALIRAGCIYYSDEYAVIAPSGMVHPYDRNLQVRQPGETIQTPTPAAALGGETGAEPLRIALVAFLRYEQDALWSPQIVTPGMAVLEMLAHTIPVQRTPARVMSALTNMMAQAAAIQSARAEAADAARALLALLEAR